MCDGMFVAMSLVEPASTVLTRINPTEVARVLGISAFEKGLGVHFGLSVYGGPFYAALLKRLGLGSEPHGYELPNVVAFEVTSSPLHTCIEEAIWNAMDPNITDPKSSPLYRFLEDVFAISTMQTVDVYFGDIFDGMAEQLSNLPERHETTDQFLGRLTTNNPASILGIGADGIFRLTRTRSDAIA